MRLALTLPLALAGGLLAGPAAAQDAARGAALYLQLPGGQASCVECHGPDPLGNRNRLLTAAGGPSVISLAITKVAAMGYLGALLDEQDRSDLSAYLARVNALDGAPLVMWPRVLEFGRVGAGAAVPEQAVRLLNLGASSVAVMPGLLPPTGFGLRHDCPPELAPGALCTAWLALLNAEPGRRSAALQWQGSDDGLPQWVGVLGRVEADAGGVLVADLPAGSLALRAAPGQAAVAEVALVNAGVAALSLGVPMITGPVPPAFRWPAVLAARPCSCSRVHAARRASRPRHRWPASARPCCNGARTAPICHRCRWPCRPRVRRRRRHHRPAHHPRRLLRRRLLRRRHPRPRLCLPPGPAPAAPEPAGASGGCAAAWAGGGAFDPLLPGLLVLALLGLRRRRMRAATVI